MRLIDADALKEKFKEHYDLFVSTYKNEQDMSVGDKSRVDEILNSMAEVINAPTVFDTDNVTNGDVIKAIFPDAKYEIIHKMSGMDYIQITGMSTYGFSVTFDLEWWNEPYQKGGKVE